MNSIISKAIKIALIAILPMALLSCNNTPEKPYWPEISQESKPWTRWWWMGNAVDKENITWQLESFAKAGLGGVEITPIYGTKGYEENFLDYLSSEWLAMLDHTLSEAERLGLGVDMTMGTGWPYGGPQVEPKFAATKLYIQKYPLKRGETFKNQIAIDDPKQKSLASFGEFVCINREGQRIDISSFTERDKIDYKPVEDATLYAIFYSKTRQQVKRSAPGGAGYTLDHFSKEAFADYAQPFTKALEPFKNRLNTIFNDSYEVYHADFTPAFFEEFQTRRGYALQDYIAVLDEKPDTEEYYRLVYDYRQTLAELLQRNFTENWCRWAHENTFKTRYQVHGSPGNLIDLYATADIPECEVFGSPHYDIPGYRRDSNNVRKGDLDKMMLKFCSSAAHLQGHELVSSESFTWLREHFKTALSHCKPVTDDLFLSGINHMFLHGSTYTMKEENWPGWKFYASVNFNETNTIWKDAPALFSYIARCQAILQEAKTDNDVLLYWPIHDAYATTHPERLLHQFGIHSIDEWLVPTSFYQTAVELDKQGFGFDYLSDQFLMNCSYENGQIKVAEEARYKTIVVPDMTTVPLATFKKLIALQQAGANVIFLGQPESVPGLHEYAQREATLKALLEDNKSLFSDSQALEQRLNAVNVYGEKAFEKGLKLIRKKLDNDIIYFVANHSAYEIDEFVHFNINSETVMLMNPMTQESGLAQTKGKNLVRLQIKPGESFFIRTTADDTEGKAWKYLAQEQTITTLDEDWTIRFIEGGPSLPEQQRITTAQSWTELGEDYLNFSGTAVYHKNFDIAKEDDKAYILDLGDVRESARVTLNGKEVCTLFAHPFSVDITQELAFGENQLSIQVTNLAANRLRALELSQDYEWKKFYEINMVNIHYQKFDAPQWKTQASGLLGPVSINSASIE